MTIKELKDSLYRHLDVEEDEEKAKYFPVALNHALDKICTVFPLYGRYVLRQSALPSVLALAMQEPYKAVHAAGESYSAAAKAYYFEVSGVGVCDIRDNNGVRRIAFNTKEYTPFRGFASGAVSLTFHGDYVFFVRHVALYHSLLSEKEEDIPAYAPSTVYDFKELTKETDEKGGVFIGFDGFLPGKFEERMPGEKAVQVFGDYEIEPGPNGHLLRIFGNTDTQKIIYYRRNFRPVTETTPEDTELEIEQGLCNILIDLCVYRMNNDESDISVERARYEADQLLAWKQQRETGANKETKFSDTKGYLNYD